MTQLLPLPEGDAGTIYRELIRAWPDPDLWPTRSRWLGWFEDLLRLDYPQATKRERNLTARHYAPFELAQGHDVP